jgi:hypothetical protein
VIVPARNERRNIERCVRSVLATSYPLTEVIVVDDRSADRTGAIARRVAAEDPRFRAVAGEDPPPGWLGKTNALRLGVRAAAGEWLLFADADVVYAPDVIRRAVSRAEEGGLALLCLLPRFESRGFWEGVAMPNIYAMLYLGPGFVTQIDAVKSFGGGSGSGNLVDRRAYEAAGGHEALRSAVVDDIGLALAMKRAGFRTGAATAYDGVRVRMYRGLRETIDGFTKNVAFLGPPLLTLTAPVALLALALAPWIVLASPAAPRAKALAAAAVGATLFGRAVVARVTRSPLWSALFHPLMVALWTAIALRSWWRRVVRRELVWRGRRTPAPRPPARPAG